ncbi:putative monooxygenase [Xylariaceae sp. FL0594]|nr:putative monooxygenase [Xylariaceae sp. FL0594]
MSNVDTDVLIIGGGIGGLALAAILRRLSIPCKVLERTERIEPVGAGISLAPNALKLLDQLGLYDTILQSGQKLNKIQITRNKTLWNVLDWSLTEKWYGYPVISAERHNFHRLLYRAAGAEETVLLNSKVKDIVDNQEESSVRVILEDGQQLCSRMVVGADGIRSLTRRVLAGAADDKASNTIRFTGRVHMSGITSPLEHLGPENIGVGNWLLYDDSILTTWPCPDNQQWFIGVKKADSAASRDRSVWAHTTPEMISDVYGERFHPFAEKGKFSEIVDHSIRILASNVFEEIEFPSMSKGRVALLGDAAHSMTSFFGQGGCQAIEDAAELANCLWRTLHRSEMKLEDMSYDQISQMLREYSQSRQKRVQDLASFSSNYARLHTADLPFGRFVRYMIYRFVPTSGWMWYLRWLYGFQPSVEGLGERKERITK